MIHKPKTDRKLISEEDRQKFLKYYQEGLSADSIADIMPFSNVTISRYIKRAIDAGEIEKRKLNRPKKEKAKGDGLGKWQRHEAKEYTTTNGVRCTRCISASCIYGVQTPIEYLCQYNLITHESRGCEWWDCTKYVKVDEDHPRLFPDNDMEDSI